MPDINLILYKENKVFDISELVEDIKWKGRKGSSARSISVTLLDDKSGLNNAVSGIDVTRGDQLVFNFKGKDCFVE